MGVMTLAYVIGSIFLWVPTLLVNVAKSQEAYVKYLNSSNVGNFMIQGCKRDLGRTYPNDLWGYGVLDLFQSFLES